MSKKIIAVAVASIVAAPAAYGDISAYGRIHNSIVFQENDDVDVQNRGSRFGFRGSSDLGNGMEAFGRYEFSTPADTNGKGVAETRLAYVGVSGSFGSVSLGQQWSAYYQNFGTHASPNIHIGPGQALGPPRTGNTLQYSNSLGPISMKLDARIDDEGDDATKGWQENGNGFGIGATLSAMDNVTLFGAFDSSETDEEEEIGLGARVSFGILSLTLAHEQQDVDKDGMMHDEENSNTILSLDASLTDHVSMRLAGGQSDYDRYGNNNDEEVTTTNVSATYNFGGGFRVWAQLTNKETDKAVGTDSDADTFAVGMRLDF